MLTVWGSQTSSNVQALTWALASWACLPASRHRPQIWRSGHPDFPDEPDGPAV